jgi:hypothetical protein
VPFARLNTAARSSQQGEDGVDGSSTSNDPITLGAQKAHIILVPMGEAIDDELVEFYYQWDRFEKVNDVEIIDFDLVQRSADFPGTFSTREDVAARLEELIRRYRNVDIPDPFVLQKLESSAMFLRALTGEHIPFSPHVSATLGVWPEMIPETVLEAARADCGARLQLMGYAFTRDGVEAFMKESRLSAAEITAEFERAQHVQVPAVLEWLGLGLAPRYELQLVDVDAPWSGETKTTDDGAISLKFNLNEGRTSWIRGDPESTALHEIGGHVLQATAWKERLESGGVAPVCGLTTLHGPETYVQEGVAETLSWFFPRPLLSDASELALRLHCMSYLHWNDAFIMAGQGRPLDEILQFLDDHMLTYRTRDQRRKNLEEAIKDPLARTYMYSYGISIYHHRLFAEHATPVQKRNYISHVFGRAYSYQDLARSYPGWYRQSSDLVNGY